MLDELDRVGIEITRKPDETWENLVVRYAGLRNLIMPCLTAYHAYVEEGIDPPYAALKALSEHACTDLIIDEQHFNNRNVTVN